jgi:hypothetical protein
MDDFGLFEQYDFPSRPVVSDLYRNVRIRIETRRHTNFAQESIENMVYESESSRNRQIKKLERQARYRYRRKR